jgi:hypothetical protein
MPPTRTNNKTHWPISGRKPEITPPPTYADACADYRALGIRTIPVGDDKKPLVKWKNVTLDSRFEEHFPNAGLAIVTGDVVTVVDVDDRALLPLALERFGETPVQVATPRGTHLWYRANGERTGQKVGGLGIDVRGIGGIAVAPPTEGRTFLKGALHLVPHLPFIKAGALAVKRAPAEKVRKPLEEMVEGDGRNTTLFRIACEANGRFAEPMSEEEVAGIVNSVLKRPPKVAVDVNELDLLRSNADAFLLLADLRRMHIHRKGRDFVFADATRERYGWTRERFGKAWKTLVAAKLLHVTRPGGKHPGNPRMAILL